MIDAPDAVIAEDAEIVDVNDQVGEGGGNQFLRLFSLILFFFAKDFIRGFQTLHETIMIFGFVAHSGMQH
jgi:hypothetical protein